MEETSTPLTNAQLTKRQELNNHIVLMRKTVRKSKVQLINKLIREAKRLKTRKGAEKAQEKSQRKATRLLEEVQKLKHLKEDQVSIYALQNKEPLQNSISRNNVAIEIRALAKLGHHHYVQLDVLKYREQNPHWELQIPVLLEKSKEKLKKSQKKEEKRHTEKVKPKLEKEYNASDSESEVEIKVKSEDEDDDSSLDKEVVGPSSTSEKSLSKKQKNIEKRLKRSHIDKGEEEPPLTADKETVLSNSDKRAAKKQKNIEKRLKKIQKLDKNEGTIKVQYLKDLTDLEKSSSDSKVKRKVEPETGSEQVLASAKRPRSSFFIGGTEEEPEDENPEPSYRTAKPFHADRRQNFSSEFKPIFRKGKLVNQNSTSNFVRGNREGRPSPRTPRYFDKQADQSTSKRRDINFQQNSSRDIDPSPVGEKLHPSWEAKKRQAKVIIPPIQRNKIAFRNDD